MWTTSDINDWIVMLQEARGLVYPEARALLLDVRDAIGESTITEAHKQKRARYLARKAQRKARKTNAVGQSTENPT